MQLVRLRRTAAGGARYKGGCPGEVGCTPPPSLRRERKGELVTFLCRSAAGIGKRSPPYDPPRPPTPVQSSKQAHHAAHVYLLWHAAAAADRCKTRHWLTGHCGRAPWPPQQTWTQLCSLVCALTWSYSRKQMRALCALHTRALTWPHLVQRPPQTGTLDTAVPS